MSNQSPNFALPVGMGPEGPEPFRESLLSAFNNKLDIRNAYGWGIYQILEFLNSALRYPKDFGADPKDIPELRTILGEIRSLSLPDGKAYSAKGQEPKQHIARQLNPEWSEHPESRNSLSKFKVVKYIHWNVPYWSPVDLLGLFLFKLGPAPPGATIRNFFLPMTALFGRWTVQMVGRSAYMYNCTWKEQGNGQAKFFLGASLTGYDAKIEECGTWYSAIQYARYKLLARPSLTSKGWSFSISPEQVTNARNIPFGKCAETYPYLHLLREDGVENAKVFGIAMKKKGTIPPQYEDSDVWQNVVDPCLNCQELICIYEGIVSNFSPYAGSRGGPP